MTPQVAGRLVALNHAFYERFSAEFAQSRARPWPGFARLADALPEPCPRFLDVGCGEGRLGRFLLDQERVGAVVGVDFSAALLAWGARVAETPMTFAQRNLTEPGCLDGLGQFDGMACVATLQHIPGHSARIRLLREMAQALAPRGRLVLVNWQFTDSLRQRRKVLPWSEAGLDASQVEASDYLLAWRRGGQGMRYVALIDAEATQQLADSAELRILDQFRADGHEGNLNLYTVLTHAGTGARAG